MDSIFHRVSVRSWTNQPVEDEKVEQILRAAMQAPSADDQQPWEFYIVDSPEKKAALAKTHKWTSCAVKAPVLIVPAYRTEGLISPEFAQVDLSIATEHMWLEADTLGLGAVWLGIAPVEKNMQYVEQVLGLPKTLRAFALFCVGYPEKLHTQKDRFDVSRIHRI